MLTKRGYVPSRNDLSKAQAAGLIFPGALMKAFMKIPGSQIREITGNFHSMLIVCK